MQLVTRVAELDDTRLEETQGGCGPFYLAVLAGLLLGYIWTLVF